MTIAKKCRQPLHFFYVHTESFGAVSLCRNYKIQQKNSNFCNLHLAKKIN